MCVCVCVESEEHTNAFTTYTIHTLYIHVYTCVCLYHVSLGPVVMVGKSAGDEKEGRKTGEEKVSKVRSQ